MKKYKLEEVTVQAIKFDGTMEMAEYISKLVAPNHTRILKDKDNTSDLVYYLKIQDNEGISRFLLKNCYILLKKHSNFEILTSTNYESLYG